MKRLLLTIFFFALTACGNETEKKTLGIKFEDFANNLNSKNSAFLIAQELDFRTTDGSDDLRLQYMFNETTALKTIINKSDHKIQNMQIVNAVGGDGRLNALKLVIDAPLLASLATQSINPQLDKSDIGPVILDLFSKAAEHQNVEQQHVLSSNSYSVKFDSEYKSYIFSITPM
ncbi:MAG: hypothetical protein Q7U15_06075 [Methylotenera sp.]|nr:hypothetical protein [Methylotenera sp.]